MKKLIVLLCLTTQLSAQKAEWTVLNCVGACNNLSSYGIANVELMKSANISTKTNWLIQLDDATNKQTLRYKIASQGITDNISIKQPLGINQKEELITALHWAATYPARYFFLLFGTMAMESLINQNDGKIMSCEAFSITLTKKLICKIKNLKQHLFKQAQKF